jgi:serine/threonine protein kinase
MAIARGNLGVHVAACVICSAEIADGAKFCPSCGAEQPRAHTHSGEDDTFIGQMVAGKFRIEGLLGVGGMGKVYRARQMTLDKDVVIKILHDHFKNDANLVQRFQREAKAASRLNHPNSIQVIDFGQDENGVLYMAIEYLEGVDLFNLLQKEFPLPEERIARICAQVCAALAEAHDQNVIHRDLKPENVMVINRRGQKDFVKVLDFGIAKIQDPEGEAQALTQQGMVCGTPEYMSPEQARGMALDPRSDIYALGVLLYQLVTGELPFMADTAIGIVTKHILENPEPPRQKFPQYNISEGMEQIILKAMAKDVDQRFQTVMEMADALQALIQGNLHSIPPAPVVASGSGPSGTITMGAQPPKTQTSPTPSVPTATAPGSVAAQSADSTAVAPTADLSDASLALPKKGSSLKWAAIGGLGVLVVAAVLGVAMSGGGGKDTSNPAAIAKADSKNSDDPKNPKNDAAGQGNGDAKGEAPAGQDDKEKGEKGAADEGADATKSGDNAAEKGDEEKAEKGKTEKGETKAVEKNTGSGKKPKGTKKPRRNRAKAQKLFAEGNSLIANGQADAGYKKLQKALKADPSFYQTIYAIAMYHKGKGDKKRACNATRDYIRKAKPSAAREAKLKKMMCGG